MAEKPKETFSLLAKLTALAIVHIFEASKPFGAFDAYVVLPDGAGVSYGVSQFTHRAGSLAAVIVNYLSAGGSVGADYFKQILPVLKQKGEGAIKQLAADKKFKHFLQLAAETDEMRAAQVDVATEKYLQPAIDACEGSRFVLPMSLAVVYDSINQGSFALIRDRVRIAKGAKSDLDFEKAWITQYVQKRDSWLENHPKKILQSTDYRTDFFLAQIARGNWDLKAPMNVHGWKLTAEQLNSNSDFFAQSNSPSDLENSPKANAGAAFVDEDQSSDDRQSAPPQNQTNDQNQDQDQNGNAPQVVINNNAPAADPNAAANGSQANSNAPTDPAPAPPVKDETVVVDQVKPELSIFENVGGKIDAIQTTFKTRYAALAASVVGFFSAIWAFIENANPLVIAAIVIGIGFILGIFIAGVLYLKNQDRRRADQAAQRDHDAKMQAAKFAQELNLVAAKSAIDPGSQTIKFVSDSSQNKK